MLGLTYVRVRPNARHTQKEGYLHMFYFIDRFFLADRQYQMTEHKDLKQRIKSFKAFADINYL
jgi:hypothetical protein